MAKGWSAAVVLLMGCSADDRSVFEPTREGSGGEDASTPEPSAAGGSVAPSARAGEAAGEAHDGGATSAVGGKGGGEPGVGSTMAGSGGNGGSQGGAAGAGGFSLGGSGGLPLTAGTDGGGTAGSTAGGGSAGRASGGAAGVGGSAGAGSSTPDEELLLELITPDATYSGFNTAEPLDHARFTLDVVGSNPKPTPESCTVLDLKVTNGWTGVKRGDISEGQRACFAGGTSDAYFWFTLPTSNGSFDARGDERRLPLSAVIVTRWEVRVTSNTWAAVAGNTYAWSAGCAVRLYGTPRKG